MKTFEEHLEYQMMLQYGNMTFEEFIRKHYNYGPLKWEEASYKKPKPDPRLYPLTPSEMKLEQRKSFKNKLIRTINTKTNKTMGHYILGKGKVPVMVSDIKEWAEKFEKQSRVVQQDTIDGAFISTVFLGIDHSWGKGTPILFETMIFHDGGLHDQFQQRYTSWKAALAGHKKACALVQSSLKPVV